MPSDTDFTPSRPLDEWEAIVVHRGRTLLIRRRVLRGIAALTALVAVGVGVPGLLPRTNTAPSTRADSVRAQLCRPASDSQPYCWTPSNLDVHVGDTITWTTTTNVAHMVESASNNWHVLGMLPTNAGDMSPHPSNFTYRFSTPGVYSYHCMLHPYMTGSITVLA